jgi:hypothetical protein
LGEDDECIYGKVPLKWSERKIIMTKEEKIQFITKATVEKLYYC